MGQKDREIRYSQKTVEGVEAYLRSIRRASLLTRDPRTFVVDPIENVASFRESEEAIRVLADLFNNLPPQADVNDLGIGGKTLLRQRLGVYGIRLRPVFETGWGISILRDMSLIAENALPISAGYSVVNLSSLFPDTHWVEAKIETAFGAPHSSGVVVNLRQDPDLQLTLIRVERLRSVGLVGLVYPLLRAIDRLAIG